MYINIMLKDVELARYFKFQKIQNIIACMTRF